MTQLLTMPRPDAGHLRVLTRAEQPVYRAYNRNNYLRIPQVQRLSDEERFAIEVVSRVLPFKANNYVVDELIDWSAAPDDPIFALTFPQAEMLQPDAFERVATLLRTGASEDAIEAAVAEIRHGLNPHPAGQMEHNVPELYGERLPGMQHKYRETVLFFPSKGQTCHAYCTFCFRWPQFVGDPSLKFAMKEADSLVAYLREHPELTDVLFTGGDPMVMSAASWRIYLEPLLAAELPNLATIRIGTKSLSYWPYRYTADKDADEILDLFRSITGRGIHLAVMAHFNHPRELSTPAVREAIERILETGAQIRTQSPLMKHINDESDAWAEMWQRQVSLGLIPYYMFVARDTGAHDYFSVPLVRAWEIYRNAYNQVSGIARTVRGPSMSATPGKVRVLGVSEVAGQKVLGLNFIQARNPDWVQRPFFAEYDPEATWLDELRPAFGEEKFFFEE